MFDSALQQPLSAAQVGSLIANDHGFRKASRLASGNTCVRMRDFLQYRLFSIGVLAVFNGLRAMAKRHTRVR